MFENIFFVINTTEANTNAMFHSVKIPGKSSCLSSKKKVLLSLDRTNIDALLQIHHELQSLWWLTRCPVLSPYALLLASIVGVSGELFSFERSLACSISLSEAFSLVIVFFFHRNFSSCFPFLPLTLQLVMFITIYQLAFGDLF